MAKSSYDNSVQSVSMAIILNSIIAAVMLAFYGALIWNEAFAKHVAPRLPRKDRPTFRQAVWGWALKAWDRRRHLYTEDLDGTVVVRFCLLGLKFSAAGSILACVLIPIYQAGQGDVVGFNDLHLANLKRDSDSFWVVVVCAYLLAGLFVHLVSVEWKHFISLRRRHFQRLATGMHGAGAAQAQRSVLVEAVPEKYCIQDGSGIRQFFEEKLFPARTLHSCVLHPDTRQMYKDPAALLRGAGQATASQLRQVLGLEPTEAAVAESLRHAYTTLTEAGSKSKAADLALEEQSEPSGGSPRKPMKKTTASQECASCCSCCGTLPGSKRSVCKLCLEPLQSIAQETYQLGRQVVHRSCQAAVFVKDLSIGAAGSETGFVTMNHLVDRIVAEQTVLSHSGCWRVTAAPEAREVIWKNAAVPLRQRKTRTVLADTVLTLGLIFWSAPVGALQVWTSLEDVSSATNWLTDSTTGMWIYTFLREYLPVLALLALQYALPVAIQFIAVEYEGYKVKSEVQRRVLNWNFRYQFATLYVTVVCGTLSISFHDQLGEVLSSPQSLFEMIRESVPQVSCYFVNYVCARVGISLPLLLFFPALTYWMRLRGKKKKRRRRKRSPDEGENRHSSSDESDRGVRATAARVASPTSIDGSPTSPISPTSPTSPTSPFSPTLTPGGDNKEPSEESELDVAPVHPDFSVEAAMLGLVLVLGLAYSVIAPAIMPICACFFGLAFLVYCWLFSFVYTPEFDALGACFEVLLQNAMQGLLLSTFCLTGMSSAFVGFDSVGFQALVLLSGLVVLATIYFERVFARPSRFMSLEDAQSVDSLDDAVAIVKSFREDYYIDPIIKAGCESDSPNRLRFPSDARAGFLVDRERARMAQEREERRERRRQERRERREMERLEQARMEEGDECGEREEGEEARQETDSGALGSAEAQTKAQASAGLKAADGSPALPVERRRRLVKGASQASRVGSGQPARSFTDTLCCLWPLAGVGAAAAAPQPRRARRPAEAGFEADFVGP